MIKAIYTCDICGKQHTMTVPYLPTNTNIIRLPLGWDYRYRKASAYAITTLYCAECREKAKKEWEEIHAGKT